MLARILSRTLLAVVAAAAVAVALADPAAAQDEPIPPARGLYHAQAADAEWWFNYPLSSRKRGRQRGTGSACVSYRGSYTRGVAWFDRPRLGPGGGEATNVVLSAQLDDGQLFEMYGAFNQYAGGVLYFKSFGSLPYGFGRIGDLRTFLSGSGPCV
jgi:hypothetical protein